MLAYVALRRLFASALYFDVAAGGCATMTALQRERTVYRHDMSRKDEDRILHGLYYYRESIDEDIAVTGDQLLWLAAHSCDEGIGWFANDQLQSFDSSAVPLEIRDKLLASKLEMPLRYLQYRRLIKYTRPDDKFFQVAVTFAGADRAMRLHTRLGRMEVWYQEHKDGFLGIVVTIAVSMATAVVTVLAAARWFWR
jgi:hypothetical protein